MSSSSSLLKTKSKYSLFPLICLLVYPVQSLVSQLVAADLAKDVVKDQGAKALTVLVTYAKDKYNNSSRRSKSFDFEIDIPTMTSVVDGWCFHISEDAYPYLTNDDSSKSLQLNNVIAVIGYYSKGKSFLVNMLHNAAQNTLDVNGLFSTREGDRIVDTGHGVTTKGITGILTGYGNGPISSATGLILDCAGRNAPTTSFRHKLKLANQCSKDDNTCRAAGSGKYDKQKLESVKHDIYDMRAKERLLDDVAIDVSNVIFYVTDELLNEDQRMILFMIEENSKLRYPKTIVVIHNFKRLAHDDPKIKSFIKEQVAHPFGAELAGEEDDLFKDTYPNMHKLSIWKSHWVIHDDTVLTVTHLVLFRHSDTGIEVNNDMFKYITVNFMNPKHQQGFKRRNRAFTQILAESIGERIGDFISFSPPSISPENKKSSVSIRESTCSRFTIAGDFANHEVTLHKWELRDLPPGQYHSEFKPNSQVFFDGKDGELLVITLDLPGLSARDEIEYIEDEEDGERLATPPPLSSGKSWYRVRYEQGTKDDENFYLVDGYCSKQFSRQSNNLFGEFSVNFPVNSRYLFHSKRLVHGRLIIWSFEQKVDKRGRAKPPPDIEFQGEVFGPSE